MRTTNIIRAAAIAGTLTGPSAAFADAASECTDGAMPPDHTITVCSQVIHNSPRSPNAYINRGYAYYAKGEDDQAIDDYNEAIRLDPKNAVAYLCRALAYTRNFNKDGAIADYNEAIRLNPKYAVAYIDRGNAYESWGKYDLAIADYSEAIRLDPKDAEAYTFRGIVYKNKSDADRAIADLTEAIRLDPKRADAYVNRGLAYHMKGEYDQAIDDYSEAIRLDPKSAFAHLHRGRAYHTRGEDDQAIDDYNEAIRLDPKAAFVYYPFRGDAYRAKKDFESARRDYNATLQEYPSSTQARDGLAALDAEAAKLAASAKPPATSALGKRVALVIGNSAYKNFPPIPNPHNDAEDLSAALKGLGFEVVTGLDLGRDAMEQDLIDFAKKARNADTALVFYAGHGIQHNGINYLAPVDAKITDETDLRRLVNLQQIIDDLQGARGVRILIVDACRDNEVMRQLASNIPATRSAAFNTRGLAAPKQAEGVLIAFATQPNQIAADGVGHNSPFTTALLHNLNKPVDVRVMFARVRAEVVGSTNNAQRPEVSDSLVGEFTFAPAAQPQ